MSMKDYVKTRLRSESGAETVEIVIGIVVFVIFGLTVFGMITRSAGTKAAQISNCLADSGNILNSSETNDGKTSDVCKNHNQKHNYTYNGEGGDNDKNGN